MDHASWLKAKDVIFEAFQRPAGEREAFVRQRCGDSPVCDDILSLLGATPTELTEHTWRSYFDHRTDDSLIDLKVGTRVGPYRIVGELGRGGMGQVFLGTDPRLQRRVALKCLLDSREKSADVRTRILHEARAAARITNQHIAAVHDVIEHDGRAFIVMEYVEGEPLAARLRRERLSIDEVITFGRQLVSALTAAHAQGIVHCDLKPSNIQVTPSGLLKVLDFGIASATRLLSTGTIGALQTGATVPPAVLVPHAHGGTPPYMSPEQLEGRPIDQRSDIFSLGVILFELSTGQRPYEGTYASQIAEAQAKGVQTADARDPNVPPALARVIARAMSHGVAERYQSALDFGIALESVEQSLVAPPLSQPQRLKRLLVRSAIGAAIVMLTLWIIGFITSVSFNFAFGRDASFARFGVEPWSRYFIFGLLAVFPVVVVMMFAAAAAVAARYLFALLELVPPIGRTIRRVRMSGRAAARAAGLDRSTTLAQALTGLGAVTLVAFFWHHEDLIHAWSSFFNSAPIEQLMPMTDSAPARNEYHIELSVLTLAFGYGLYRVIQLRKRERTRDGRVAVGMLAAVIAIMVLLNETPYRTFHHRDFERADVAGERCYIIGESGDELLMLCPGREPPRNRTVQRGDPQLRRLGVIENVFKGVAPRPSVP